MPQEIKNPNVAVGSSDAEALFSEQDLAIDSGRKSGGTKTGTEN